MSEPVMGTAATEAIRIAETYLPKASLKRRMALAREIGDAITICEIELSQEIGRDLEALLTDAVPRR